MPETLLIGTPVHAIVLEPLNETFPAVGEVVILKRIGHGRIRVRSRHLYKNQPVTEEFDEIQLVQLCIVPDTDKSRCSGMAPANPDCKFGRTENPPTGGGRHSASVA